MLLKGRPIGYHHTEETKQKLREAQTGKKSSEETKRKIRESAKRGIEHWKWKGDEAEYSAIHRWVKRYKPKADRCERCGTTDKKLQIAHIDHSAGRKTPEKYKKDINLYRWFCCKCHRILDGRNENLKLAWTRNKVVQI
jgi:hypothetical protein